MSSPPANSKDASIQAVGNSPTSCGASNSQSPPRRPPFPHTVEILFVPSPTAHPTPTLLFNFTHSGRTPTADSIKAHIFHTTSYLPTTRPSSKVVAIPYPAGLSKVYFARAGNVGLEFENEEALREFQEGICGVGHVSVREEVGVFRLYLGSKRVDYGGEYGQQAGGGAYVGTLGYGFQGGHSVHGGVDGSPRARGHSHSGHI